MLRSLGHILVILILTVGLCKVAARLPYGNPQNTRMDDYFIANAQEDTACNNVVTSIVFDYRGFDTIGEATVLFSAVLGVGLVLRRVRRTGTEVAHES